MSDRGTDDCTVEDMKKLYQSARITLVRRRRRGLLGGSREEIRKSQGGGRGRIYLKPKYAVQVFQVMGEDLYLHVVNIHSAGMSWNIPGVGLDPLTHLIERT